MVTTGQKEKRTGQIDKEEERQQSELDSPRLIVKFIGV